MNLENEEQERSMNTGGEKMKLSHPQEEIMRVAKEDDSVIEGLQKISGQWKYVQRASLESLRRKGLLYYNREVVRYYPTNFAFSVEKHQT